MNRLQSAKNMSELMNSACLKTPNVVIEFTSKEEQKSNGDSSAQKK